MEGNTNTPPIVRQLTTNLNLRAKTPWEDIAVDHSNSEDGERHDDDKMEGNTNAFNNASEIQNTPICKPTNYGRLQNLTLGVVIDSRPLDYRTSEAYIADMVKRLMDESKDRRDDE